MRSIHLDAKVHACTDLVPSDKTLSEVMQGRVYVEMMVTERVYIQGRATVFLHYCTDQVRTMKACQSFPASIRYFNLSAPSSYSAARSMLPFLIAHSQSKQVLRDPTDPSTPSSAPLGNGRAAT